jgi:Zn-dependent peptidase ImmA (M78 family)/transcriptional regulator with XRE-family HTH domain
MQVTPMTEMRMINGDRIKQARELVGITQAELAEKVGVNQSTIAYVEQSAPVFAPSDALIESIAFQLGFPVSYFRRGAAPDFPLGSLLYRRRKSLKAQDRNRIRQFARFAYELAEYMSDRLQLPSLTLPRIVNEDPATAAQVTRATLGLSPDTPIKNLIYQLEKNGVLVLAIPYDIDEHDSFSIWVSENSPPKPVIIISAGKPGDRQRYSVSHELGHLIKHRDYQGGLSAMEDEADLFAAEFLMPAEVMYQELQAPITLAKLAALKLRWGVSMQALVVRAHQLGTITPRQYTYLFQQLTKLGYRKKEPENLDIQAEKPRGLRKMAELIYGIPINYEKIAADMDVSASLVKTLFDIYADRQDLERRPKEDASTKADDDNLLNRGNKPKSNVVSIFGNRKNG